ncbi:MAG: hypothetical protein Q8N85_01660 [Candidatus Omnitrophota bacterium]|nr:hypothetical protein [Candidatus Omnitrophota bacterium]
MVAREKTIYCSAGLNYLLIYPNGDAYRCMADYNSRRPPLFNVLGGWKSLNSPLLCTQEQCHAACDIDWATKWVFEKGRKGPKEIQAAQVSCLDPQKKKIWAGQTLEKPLRGIAHISWMPSLLCNYTCAYCGCAVGEHAIYKDFISSHPELSPQQWLKAWTDILRFYKGGFVTVSGGEPLLSKDTIPTLEMVSEKFLVNITTNLSVNVMNLVKSRIRLAEKDGDRGIASLTASLHPTSREFNKDAFFGAALYLKRNGYNVYVNFVGYPLQLYLAPMYKEWCDKNEIPFYISAWCGQDNNGFQASYSEEEKHFINSLAPEHKQTDMQVSFSLLGFSIELEKKGPIQVKQGMDYILKGAVANTGDAPWQNEFLAEENAFKVGGKIYAYADQRNVLREARAFLPRREIIPGESHAFEMKMDVNGLEAGLYALELDIVKERSYWFKEKGVQTKKIKINIAPQKKSNERSRKAQSHAG